MADLILLLIVNSSLIRSKMIILASTVIPIVNNKPAIPGKVKMASIVMRTANTIRKSGIKCKKINKVSGGSPHIVDVLNAKKIALVINTGGGKRAYRVYDSTSLRRATLINKVPYCTNMSTAYACLEGIKSLKSKKIKVKAIQEL